MERLRMQVRRAIVANALAWLAVLLLVGVGLYWQDRRDQDRQREICGLITVTDDAYAATPPAGQGGKAFAKALHDYRLRIGCINTPLPTPAKT